MKTLRRYLVSEVLLSTLLVLGALLMLYVVFDFLNELSDTRANYGPFKTLLITLANVPANVYLLLPIAALLGSLFALAQLNVNSEYTVMRASGASVFQIAWPLAVLGLVFAIIGFLLAEYAVPAAESLGQRARAYAGKAVPQTQRFRSGFWFKESRTFVNIGDVLPDARLANIRIFEFDPDGRLLSLVRAQVAANQGDTRWSLSGVSRLQFTSTRIDSQTMPTMEWNTVLTPNLLSALQMQPERLSASSLWEYSQHLRRNNQKANKFEAALWGKILYPLASCVLVVLALPFAQVSRRSGGMGLRIFIGILLGLLFILLNRLFSFLGLLYDWPPAFGALFPYAMFMVLTVVMIYRVEKR
jgi:lipopolysaccharide export system permease protein